MIVLDTHEPQKHPVILEWPDGHRTGPIGGEMLRFALSRGAKSGREWPR
jgi:hypothetical protein